MFASHAPLTLEDADTHWRVKQLELLNFELDLIEPWIAGGTLTTSVTSTDHEIQAAVLEASGAYMVLPVWSGKGAAIRTWAEHRNGRDFVRRAGRAGNHAAPTRCGQGACACCAAIA